MIVTSLFHSFKTDAETFTAATVEGDTLIIANTRNEESASEGNYMNLVTVIPLVEAIKIAKMVLATQAQADDDAMIDEMWKRHQDRAALVDSALEHDIQF